MCKCFISLWAQLGLNQWPPDYESGATNQLSYRPDFQKSFRFLKSDCKSNQICSTAKIIYLFFLAYMKNIAKNSAKKYIFADFM